MIHLTGRQKEILNLLMRGQTSKEIAFHLGIKTRTVRKHIQQIINKLGAKTLVHAVAKFILEDESRPVQELSFSI